MTGNESTADWPTTLFPTHMYRLLSLPPHSSARGSYLHFRSKLIYLFLSDVDGRRPGQAFCCRVFRFVGFPVFVVPGVGGEGGVYAVMVPAVTYSLHARGLSHHPCKATEPPSTT